MSKKLLWGLIAVIILLVGGYFLVGNSSSLQGRFAGIKSPVSAPSFGSRSTSTVTCSETDGGQDYENYGYAGMSDVAGNVNPGADVKQRTLDFGFLGTTSRWLTMKTGPEIITPKTNKKRLVNNTFLIRHIIPSTS